MILDVAQLMSTHLLGMDWMDPTWLFKQFQGQFFVLCLVIVFVECGLFFPFLPGDTLLFSIGLFITAEGDLHLNVNIVAALAAFTAAAFLGNVVGYEIGRMIGPTLSQRDGRILKKKYFEQTEVFFDKHGNKALVIGRFVPFVRTYITVVAGITRMDRRRFLTWSAVGAVLWVFTIILLGYFLGSAFPKLGESIDLIILALLAVSVLPIGYEWIKHRRQVGAVASDLAGGNDSDVEI